MNIKELESHPMLTFFRVSGFGDPGASLDRDVLGTDICISCGAKGYLYGFEHATMGVGGRARKWKDIIQCTDGMILHERVIKTIREEKLTGFKEHPVTIRQVDTPSLRALPLPQYYLLEVTGQVDVVEAELDDVGGSICPMCRRRNPKPDSEYRWTVKRIVPILETWDGSDFVKIRNCRVSGGCSKRFVDLACLHRWTNFRFGCANSMPGTGMWEKDTGSAVSYLDPKWFEKVSVKVRNLYPDLF